MSLAAYPYTSFTGTILSAQVMANYDHVRDYINATVVETSGNQTIAGVKTFSSAPVFSVGFTVTASGFTVSAGGATITGNSTITGTLTSLTGITSSGTAAFATVTASATITAGTGLTITTGNFSMGSGQAALKYYNAGDSGASLGINWNSGQEQRVRLTASAPTLTLSNPVAGTYYVLGLVQDGTGSRLMPTISPTPKWDGGTTPTLTTTASRKDKIVLFYNGTDYEGSVSALNLDTTN